VQRLLPGRGGYDQRRLRDGRMCWCYSTPPLERDVRSQAPDRDPVGRDLKPPIPTLTAKLVERVRARLRAQPHQPASFVRAIATHNPPPAWWSRVECIATRSICGPPAMSSAGHAIRVEIASSNFPALRPEPQYGARIARGRELKLSVADHPAQAHSTPPYHAAMVPR